MKHTKEPRLWVVDFEDGARQVHLDKPTIGECFFAYDGTPVEAKDCFEVVKMSAYQELKEECERLSQSKDMIADWLDAKRDIERKNFELTKENERLRYALAFYADELDDEGKRAREALNKKDEE